MGLIARRGCLFLPTLRLQNEFDHLACSSGTASVHGHAVNCLEFLGFIDAAIANPTRRATGNVGYSKVEADFILELGDTYSSSST
jgi:hypothetical protein